VYEKVLAASKFSTGALSGHRLFAWAPYSPEINKMFRWALPPLTAAGLGVWRLGGPALWADELATWGAVRLSWSQLWQLTGSVDAVVLPYYALLKAYTALAGTGTIALRLPSVAAVTATAVVVAALGRRLAGDRAGLVAGLMFALIPGTSRYAQEARPYALTALFAALSLLFLIRLRERPDFTTVSGYAATTALTGLFHPLSAVLMLAAHAAAVIGRGWRPAGTWLAAAAIGSVPALVLSVRGLAQGAQVSWIRLLDGDALEAVPQNLFASAAVGGIVLGLAAVGIRRGVPGVCVACAGFIPPALLLVAGIWAPVWVGRYVLLAVPALAVLAGAEAARAGRVQAATAIAVGVLFSYPMQLDLRSPAGHGQDSARIAEIIGPRYLAGDVVVFPDTPPSLPWAPRDIYERYLPEPRPPDVLRETAQRADGQFLASECLWAACLGTPARIWVIRADHLPDPLDGMPPAKRMQIAKHYKRVQRWNYPLLNVVLYERMPR
jgi:mannosyltransferase